jgi:hypothetical protein
LSLRQVTTRTYTHARTDLALRPSKRNPKFVVPIDFGGAEGLVLRGLSFGHVSRNAGVPGAGGKVRCVG